MRCQVSRCPNAAEFRCSAGLRYCQTHRTAHGSQGEQHSFRKIPLRERISEAKPSNTPPA